VDQRTQQPDHTGPTGVGKSYLACAFAQKACREGFNSLYLRVSKLFEDMSLAKGDGRYLKLLTTIAKTDLLVLDDYGLAPLIGINAMICWKSLKTDMDSNQHWLPANSLWNSGMNR
jgi:hypothetical protein